MLRYVGRLNRQDGATVRLEALPADHPFAHMNLTDNIVRYESHRYSANPLVVQGPGAGSGGHGRRRVRRPAASRVVPGAVALADAPWTIAAPAGDEPVCIEQAIMSGTAPDGGLYVPDALPDLGMSQHSTAPRDFPDVACRLLEPFVAGSSLAPELRAASARRR